MIEVAQLNEERHLVGYQRQLAHGFRQLIDALDPSVVDDKSHATVKPGRNGPELEIVVAARDPHIPGLSLTASAEQCILVLAGGEYLECHTGAATAEGLAEQILIVAERYLRGTTVVEHFNRRGRCVRIDNFFGRDTENEPSCKIGSSTFPLVFPRAITDSRKHVLSFLRTRPEDS